MRTRSTALIPVPKWSYRRETQIWSTALIPVPKWSYTEEICRSEVRPWSPYRSEATQRRYADLKYGLDPRTEVKLHRGDMQIWSTALIPVPKWSHRRETQIWSTASIPVPKWSHRRETQIWSTALIPVPKWSYRDNLKYGNPIQKERYRPGVRNLSSQTLCRIGSSRRGIRISR